MSKFKILWIEDQPNKIDLEKERIEETIKTKGFTPEVDLISKITPRDLSINSTLFEKIKSREYDLLFIDYHLCNDILGSSIIGSIRKDNNIYVDIIFYSSDRENLIESIKNSFDGAILEFFDDVHIAILDDSDFYDKVEIVIDKIIGSWYNAHSIRGILLAKTSKFETMVNDIVLLKCNAKQDVLREKLLQKKSNLEKNFTDQWEKALKDADLPLYVVSNPISFNWAIRKLLFDTLIEEGNIIIDNKEFATQLVEVFKLRNDFAHNKARISNGNLILNIKGEDKIFNEEDIFNIRLKINNIENVLNTLISKE